jgi:hypothetical protein
MATRAARADYGIYTVGNLVSDEWVSAANTVNDAAWVQENNRDQHLKSTQLSLNMCGRT